ncbi:MAG: hypothetical protein PUI38_07920 [Candidatus Treponema excrementipullorum]|nr:hypothetical protein [Candidatus Treponema excrementipullorum]
MEHVDYFKLQSKNLLKDFNTRFFDPKEDLYCYKPKFFDIDQIFLDFDLPDYEENFSFTLMNAQHIISKLAGFSKWGDLAKASQARLELAHLLYDNAYKISIEEWERYMNHIQDELHRPLSDKEPLEIFKKVFLESENHRSDYIPYRIDLQEKYNEIPDLPIQDKEFDYDSVYTELSEPERQKAVKAEAEFPLSTIVECLHCGKRFPYGEAKAVKIPDGDVFIVCKHYPDCDGSLIDFFPAEEADDWN